MIWHLTFFTHLKVVVALYFYLNRDCMYFTSFVYLHLNPLPFPFLSDSLKEDKGREGTKEKKLIKSHFHLSPLWSISPNTLLILPTFPIDSLRGRQQKRWKEAKKKRKFIKSHFHLSPLWSTSPNTFLTSSSFYQRSLFSPDSLKGRRRKKMENRNEEKEEINQESHPFVSSLISSLSPHANTVYLSQTHLTEDNGK